MDPGEIEDQTLNFIFSEEKDIAALLLLQHALPQLGSGSFVYDLTDGIDRLMSTEHFNNYCADRRVSETRFCASGQFDGCTLPGPFLDETIFEMRQQPAVSGMRAICTDISPFARGVPAIEVFNECSRCGGVVGKIVTEIQREIKNSYNNGRYKSLYIDITAIREWLPELR